jgi:hypothetical protein
MQIILVHPRLKRARTLDIGRRTLAVFALALVLVTASASGLLSYVTLRLAVPAQLSFVQSWLPAPEPVPTLASPDEIVRQHIDALAVRLGEMQAHLVRLDALSERVAAMAGLQPVDLGVLAAPPGRGGPLPAGGELTEEIERAAAAFDQRSDELALLESELIFREASARLVPNAQPLADALVGSRFGSRIDPFTGARVAHEGLDFSAPTGAPILAAAAGIVVFSGRNGGYGNMVDIDHGNGLVTRYAHASRLDVAAGDIVRQGQKIAEVGSTGRSTGPHLHFEVHVEGRPRDPLPYLRAGMRGRGSTDLARSR